MSIAFSEDGFETEEPLVTTSLTRADENEGPLRPKTLHEYIGQAKAQGNRVSLNLTLVGNGPRLFLSAITAGGSQAMLFKINTLGEEAFLDKVEALLNGWKG